MWSPVRRGSIEACRSYGLTIFRFLPTSDLARRPEVLDSMTIILPPELEMQISPQEAALHLAIGLFADDKLTLG